MKGFILFTLFLFTCIYNVFAQLPDPYYNASLQGTLRTSLGVYLVKLPDLQHLYSQYYTAVVQINVSRHQAQPFTFSADNFCSARLVYEEFKIKNGAEDTHLCISAKQVASHVEKLAAIEQALFKQVHLLAQAAFPMVHTNHSSHHVRAKRSVWSDILHFLDIADHGAQTDHEERLNVLTSQTQQLASLVQQGDLQISTLASDLQHEIKLVYSLLQDKLLEFENVTASSYIEFAGRHEASERLTSFRAELFAYSFDRLNKLRQLLQSVLLASRGELSDLIISPSQLSSLLATVDVKLAAEKINYRVLQVPLSMMYQRIVVSAELSTDQVIYLHLQIPVAGITESFLAYKITPFAFTPPRELASFANLPNTRSQTGLLKLSMDTEYLLISPEEPTVLLLMSHSQYEFCKVGSHLCSFVVVTDDPTAPRHCAMAILKNDIPTALQICAYSVQPLASALVVQLSRDMYMIPARKEIQYACRDRTGALSLSSYEYPIESILRLGCYCSMEMHAWTLSYRITGCSMETFTLPITPLLPTLFESPVTMKLEYNRTSPQWAPSPTIVSPNLQHLFNIIDTDVLHLQDNAEEIQREVIDHSHESFSFLGGMSLGPHGQEVMNWLSVVSFVLAIIASIVVYIIYRRCRKLFFIVSMLTTRGPSVVTATTTYPALPTLPPLVSTSSPCDHSTIFTIGLCLIAVIIALLIALACALRKVYDKQKSTQHYSVVLRISTAEAYLDVPLLKVSRHLRASIGVMLAQLESVRLESVRLNSSRTAWKPPLMCFSKATHYLYVEYAMTYPHFKLRRDSSIGMEWPPCVSVTPGQAHSLGALLAGSYDTHILLRDDHLVYVTKPQNADQRSAPAKHQPPTTGDSPSANDTILAGELNNAVDQCKRHIAKGTPSVQPPNPSGTDLLLVDCPLEQPSRTHTKAPPTAEAYWDVA